MLTGSYAPVPAARRLDHRTRKLPFAEASVSGRAWDYSRRPASDLKGRSGHCRKPASHLLCPCRLNSASRATCGRSMAGMRLPGCGKSRSFLNAFPFGADPHLSPSFSLHSHILLQPAAFLNALGRQCRVHCSQRNLGKYSVGFGELNAGISQFFSGLQKYRS